MKSMTGFATRRGAGHGFEWTWDVRSVNGKGLDLRLRVPDWVTGLDQGLRKLCQGALARGSVQVSLKLARASDAVAPQVDVAALDAVLAFSSALQAEADKRGITVAPLSVSEIWARLGQSDAGLTPPEIASLVATLLAEAAALVDDLQTMRATEGAALQTVLAGQLDQFSDLMGQARAVLPDRKAGQDANFQAALDRLAQAPLDADRLAQELAVLAVKSDVAEEMDRLDGHIAAARDLVGQDAPVGRKLDFLMQEFNREVNTLCSKSAHGPLTATGLEMKVLVDQMREQIQNVE